jgi:uncharacterized protein (TIGR03435 family)
LDSIRPRSQAFAASARVLKNLAAHNHLSIRTVEPVMLLFSYHDGMRTILTVFTLCLAHGQTFDAASIKPAAMPTMGGRGMIRMAGPSGGPGTNDPGRVHYPFINLKNLLMNAYDVKGFQISGPSWLDTERFDIQATMPPETTKEQFRVMLQNLLAERFGLKVHHETKELPMYSLVVAKGGPKMKESAVPPPDSGEPATPPPLPQPGQLKMGADGFPVLPGMATGRPACSR